MVDAGNASVPPDAAGMADAPYAPGPAESVPPLEGDIRVSEAGLPASEMNGSVSSPAGAEAVDSGPDRRPGAVQAVRAESSAEENPVRELGRLLDEFSRPGANIGPDALFRAQYLAGMLRVQAQTGLKTSQSASQGMESVLRQQG